MKAIEYKFTEAVLFSFAAAEVRKDSEQAVADQGERSVQPLGGDGLHFDAAKTPDAPGPLTWTQNKEDTSTRNVRPQSALNGLGSQNMGPGTNHAGPLGTSGKLAGT